MHELILRLPNGYDTEVTSHAERISLGQRQRIGLARALFGSPALVVLDEPNSNLDGAGDSALLAALEELKTRGITSIIVSHRAEVLKAANKVALIQGGALTKFGDRDDVLKPAPRSARILSQSHDPETRTLRQKVALATPKQSRTANRQEVKND